MRSTIIILLTYSSIPSVTGRPNVLLGPPSEFHLDWLIMSVSSVIDRHWSRPSFWFTARPQKLRLDRIHYQFCLLQGTTNTQSVIPRRRHPQSHMTMTVTFSLNCIQPNPFLFSTWKPQDTHEIIHLLHHTNAVFFFPLTRYIPTHRYTHTHDDTCMYCMAW